MSYRSVSRLALVALPLLAMPFTVANRAAVQAASRAAQQGAPPSPSDALLTALQRGATAEVGRLLAGGASVDAVDADGTPLLMAAVLYGNADIVALLLKRGADANRTDPAGSTALMWAVPDLAKVRLLVEHGASVNARSKNGRTPLLVAASYPRTLDVVRLLVDRGADIRAEDQGRTTALALATSARRIRGARRHSRWPRARPTSTSCASWSTEDSIRKPSRRPRGVPPTSATTSPPSITSCRRTRARRPKR